MVIAMAISTAESNFLPAFPVRQGSANVYWRVWGAAALPHRFHPSAGHALGTGRDVVEGQGHRHAGVETHQGDHVGDALMAERLDGAVIEPLRDPARIGEA